MLKQLLKKFKIDIQYLTAITGLLLYLKKNPTILNLTLRGLGINEGKLKIGKNQFDFDGNKITDSDGNEMFVYKDKVIIGNKKLNWDLIGILYLIGRKKGILK